MRVAEVWEGFRVACFAPPEPEMTGAFREDCLRASNASNICANLSTSPSSAAACRFEVRQGVRVPWDAPAEPESHAGLSEGNCVAATNLGAAFFRYFLRRSNERSEHVPTCSSRRATPGISLRTYRFWATFVCVAGTSFQMHATVAPLAMTMRAQPITPQGCPRTTQANQRN